MKRIFNSLKSFGEAHERLKHRVHTAWRIPLPSWGMYVMGGIYATVPVVGGWMVMQWAISKSHESIGEKGEKLERKNIEGFGNVTILDGEKRKIGAGGLLGGVHLVASDESEQERSKAALQKILKRIEKRERKRKKAMEEEG